jgi:hypothetical protein
MPTREEYLHAVANYEIAKQIIEDYYIQLKNEIKDIQIVKTKIDNTFIISVDPNSYLIDLPNDLFSVRLHNQLWRYYESNTLRSKKVKDLLSLDYEKFLRQKNVGKTLINEIEMILKLAGLK